MAWITRMHETLPDFSGNGPTQADREEFVRRTVQGLASERTLTLARYELSLHAARDPQLQRLTSELRARHVAVQAQIFTAAGAADPQFAAKPPAQRHRRYAAVPAVRARARVRALGAAVPVGRH